MSGSIKSYRRKYISAPLFKWYKSVLPPMSDTEREALEAGTVWWDAELFSGKPDWAAIRANPAPALSAEEQTFLDGPTEELCAMIDEWEVTHKLRQLPENVWDFIKSRGFLGMIIPKEHGGLGFSALAHSAVVSKLSTRSAAGSVSVMVPNSLGPAELLLHYGTDEQKAHYLPRLAKGTELPCFALTGPDAGSDAAAMPDVGIVCYEEVDGKKTLGMRVSWEKRYITLGPIATVLGLAFKLFDPDNILGDEKDLGITLALIPTDTPGVNIGRRHFPAGQAFQNGPNSGKDVFIPMDWVIGGQERVGQGWRMLMDSLSAGRSISLPSSSTGIVKLCARMTGAYSRVRKQFKTPIGYFEGVEEALARIAENAYVMDAGRQITAAAVDAGQKPSVISAIVKYHFTERSRTTVNDAMDIHGGRGICDGPSNYLFNAYASMPVGITVEGANILTRSLIIFGQGAIRCHPYLLKEMNAARVEDEEQGLTDFDDAFFGHMAFSSKNFGRALLHNLTGAMLVRSTGPSEISRYYRQLSRTSASFAILADLALLILGGELKRREKLSARFGDVLSEMYMMTCALKRYEDEGCQAEDLPLVQSACENGLKTIDNRLSEILANFPSRSIGFVMGWVLFPWGRRNKGANDKVGRECARLLLSPGAARDRLTNGMYVTEDPEDVTGCMEHALKTVIAAEAVERKLKTARKAGTISGRREALMNAGLDANIINEAEAALLKESFLAIRKAIMVDDFAPEELSPVESVWKQDMAKAS